MAAVEELQELRTGLSVALARVERLIERGSAPPAAADNGALDVMNLPRTKAIEWALVHQGRPMRPVEIWSALQAVGRNDPKTEIQVTTYDLWQRGRIDRIGRGVYRAAPSIQPDEQSATDDQHAKAGEEVESRTTDQLRVELMRFEEELRTAGLKENSIRTYVDRTAYFLRWLDGDYEPGSSADNH